MAPMAPTTVPPMTVYREVPLTVDSGSVGCHRPVVQVELSGAAEKESTPDEY